MQQKDNRTSYCFSHSAANEAASERPQFAFPDNSQPHPARHLPLLFAYSQGQEHAASGLQSPSIGARREKSAAANSEWWAAITGTLLLLTGFAVATAAAGMPVSRDSLVSDSLYPSPQSEIRHRQSVFLSLFPIVAAAATPVRGPIGLERIYQYDSAPSCSHPSAALLATAREAALRIPLRETIAHPGSYADLSPDTRLVVHMGGRGSGSRAKEPSSDAYVVDLDPDFFHRATPRLVFEPHSPLRDFPDFAIAAANKEATPTLYPFGVDFLSPHLQTVGPVSSNFSASGRRPPFGLRFSGKTRLWVNTTAWTQHPNSTMDTQGGQTSVDINSAGPLGDDPSYTISVWLLTMPMRGNDGAQRMVIFSKSLNPALPHTSNPAERQQSTSYAYPLPSNYKLELSIEPWPGNPSAYEGKRQYCLSSSNPEMKSSACTPTGSVVFGRWVHLAVSVSKTNVVTFYLDGKQLGKPTASALAFAFPRHKPDSPYVAGGGADELILGGPFANRLEYGPGVDREGYIGAMADFRVFNGAEMAATLFRDPPNDGRDGSAGKTYFSTYVLPCTHPTAAFPPADAPTLQEQRNNEVQDSAAPDAYGSQSRDRFEYRFQHPPLDTPRGAVPPAPVQFPARNPVGSLLLLGRIATPAAMSTDTQWQTPRAEDEAAGITVTLEGVFPFSYFSLIGDPIDGDFYQASFSIAIGRGKSSCDFKSDRRVRDLIAATTQNPRGLRRQPVYSGDPSLAPFLTVAFTIPRKALNNVTLFPHSETEFALCYVDPPVAGSATHWTGHTVSMPIFGTATEAVDGFLPFSITRLTETDSSAGNAAPLGSRRRHRWGFRATLLGLGLRDGMAVVLTPNPTCYGIDAINNNKRGGLTPEEARLKEAWADRHQWAHVFTTFGTHAVGGSIDGEDATLTSSRLHLVGSEMSGFLFTAQTTHRIPTPRGGSSGSSTSLRVRGDLRVCVAPSVADAIAGTNMWPVTLRFSTQLPLEVIFGHEGDGLETRVPGSLRPLPPVPRRLDFTIMSSSGGGRASALFGQNGNVSAALRRGFVQQYVAPSSSSTEEEAAPVNQSTTTNKTIGAAPHVPFVPVDFAVPCGAFPFSEMVGPTLGTGLAYAYTLRIATPYGADTFAIGESGGRNGAFTLPPSLCEVLEGTLKADPPLLGEDKGSGSSTTASSLSYPAPYFAYLRHIGSVAPPPSAADASAIRTPCLPKGNITIEAGWGNCWGPAAATMTERARALPLSPFEEVPLNVADDEAFTRQGFGVFPLSYADGRAFSGGAGASSVFAPHRFVPAAALLNWTAVYNDGANTNANSSHPRLYGPSRIGAPLDGRATFGRWGYGVHVPSSSSSSDNAATATPLQKLPERDMPTSLALLLASSEPSMPFTVTLSRHTVPRPRTAADAGGRSYKSQETKDEVDNRQMAMRAQNGIRGGSGEEEREQYTLFVEPADANGTVYCYAGQSFAVTYYLLSSRTGEPPTAEECRPSGYAPEKVSAHLAFGGFEYTNSRRFACGGTVVVRCPTKSSRRGTENGDSEGTVASHALDTLLRPSIIAVTNLGLSTIETDAYGPAVFSLRRISGAPPGAVFPIVAVEEGGGPAGDSSDKEIGAPKAMEPAAAAVWVTEMLTLRVRGEVRRPIIAPHTLDIAGTTTGGDTAAAAAANFISRSAVAPRRDPKRDFYSYFHHKSADSKSPCNPRSPFVDVTNCGLSRHILHTSAASLALDVLVGGSAVAGVGGAPRHVHSSAEISSASRPSQTSAMRAAALGLKQYPYTTDLPLDRAAFMSADVDTTLCTGAQPKDERIANCGAEYSGGQRPSTEGYASPRLWDSFVAFDPAAGLEWHGEWVRATPLFLKRSGDDDSSSHHNNKNYNRVQQALFGAPYSYRNASSTIVAGGEPDPLIAAAYQRPFSRKQRADPPVAGIQYFTFAFYAPTPQRLTLHLACGMGLAKGNTSLFGSGGSSSSSSSANADSGGDGCKGYINGRSFEAAARAAAIVVPHRPLFSDAPSASAAGGVLAAPSMPFPADSPFISASSHPDAAADASAGAMAPTTADASNVTSYQMFVAAGWHTVVLKMAHSAAFDVNATTTVRPAARNPLEEAAPAVSARPPAGAYGVGVAITGNGIAYAHEVPRPEPHGAGNGGASTLFSSASPPTAIAEDQFSPKSLPAVPIAVRIPELLVSPSNPINRPWGPVGTPSTSMAQDTLATYYYGLNASFYALTEAVIRPVVAPFEAPALPPSASSDPAAVAGARPTAGWQYMRGAPQWNSSANTAANEEKETAEWEAWLPTPTLDRSTASVYYASFAIYSTSNGDAADEREAGGDLPFFETRTAHPSAWISEAIASRLRRSELLLSLGQFDGLPHVRVFLDGAVVADTRALPPADTDDGSTLTDPLPASPCPPPRGAEACVPLFFPVGGWHQVLIKVIPDYADPATIAPTPEEASANRRKGRIDLRAIAGTGRACTVALDGLAVVCEQESPASPHAGAGTRRSAYYVRASIPPVALAAEAAAVAAAKGAAPFYARLSTSAGMGFDQSSAPLGAHGRMPRPPRGGAHLATPTGLLAEIADASTAEMPLCESTDGKCSSEEDGDEYYAFVGVDGIANDGPSPGSAPIRSLLSLEEATRTEGAMPLLFNGYGVPFTAPPTLPPFHPPLYPPHGATVTSDLDTIDFGPALYSEWDKGITDRRYWDKGDASFVPAPDSEVQLVLRPSVATEMSVETTAKWRVRSADTPSGRFLSDVGSGGDWQRFYSFAAHIPSSSTAASYEEVPATNGGDSHSNSVYVSRPTSADQILRRRNGGGGSAVLTDPDSDANPSSASVWAAGAPLLFSVTYSGRLNVWINGTLATPVRTVLVAGSSSKALKRRGRGARNDGSDSTDAAAAAAAHHFTHLTAGTGSSISSGPSSDAPTAADEAAGAFRSYFNLTDTLRLAAAADISGGGSFKQTAPFGGTTDEGVSSQTRIPIDGGAFVTVVIGVGPTPTPSPKEAATNYLWRRSARARRRQWWTYQAPAATAFVQKQYDRSVAKPITNASASAFAEAVRHRLLATEPPIFVAASMPPTVHFSLVPLPLPQRINGATVGRNPPSPSGGTSKHEGSLPQLLQAARAQCASQGAGRRLCSRDAVCPTGYPISPYTFARRTASIHFSSADNNGLPPSEVLLTRKYSASPFPPLPARYSALIDDADYSHAYVDADSPNNGVWGKCNLENNDPRDMTIISSGPPLSVPIYAACCGAAVVADDDGEGEGIGIGSGSNDQFVPDWETRPAAPRTFVQVSTETPGSFWRATQRIPNGRRSSSYCTSSGTRCAPPPLISAASAPAFTTHAPHRPIAFPSLSHLEISSANVRAPPHPSSPFFGANLTASSSSSSAAPLPPKGKGAAAPMWGGSSASLMMRVALVPEMAVRAPTARIACFAADSATGLKIASGWLLAGEVPAAAGGTYGSGGNSYTHLPAAAASSLLTLSEVEGEYMHPHEPHSRPLRAGWVALGAAPVILRCFSVIPPDPSRAAGGLLAADTTTTITSIAVATSGQPARSSVIPSRVRCVAGADCIIRLLTNPTPDSFPDPLTVYPHAPAAVAVVTDRSLSTLDVDYEASARRFGGNVGGGSSSSLPSSPSSPVGYVLALDSTFFPFGSANLFELSRSARRAVRLVMEARMAISAADERGGSGGRSSGSSGAETNTNGGNPLTPEQVLDELAALSVSPLMPVRAPFGDFTIRGAYLNQLELIRRQARRRIEAANAAASGGGDDGNNATSRKIASIADLFSNFTLIYFDSNAAPIIEDEIAQWGGFERMASGAELIAAAEDHRRIPMARPSRASAASYASALFGSDDAVGEIIPVAVQTLPIGAVDAARPLPIITHANLNAVFNGATASSADQPLFPIDSEAIRSPFTSVALMGGFEADDIIGFPDIMFATSSSSGENNKYNEEEKEGVPSTLCPHITVGKYCDFSWYFGHLADARATGAVLPFAATTTKSIVNGLLLNTSGTRGSSSSSASQSLPVVDTIRCVCVASLSKLLAGGTTGAATLRALGGSAGATAERISNEALHWLRGNASASTAIVRLPTPIRLRDPPAPPAPELITASAAHSVGPQRLQSTDELVLDGLFVTTSPQPSSSSASSLALCTAAGDNKGSSSSGNDTPLRVSFECADTIANIKNDPNVPRGGCSVSTPNGTVVSLTTTQMRIRVTSSPGNSGAWRVIVTDCAGRLVAVPTHAYFTIAPPQIIVTAADGPCARDSSRCVTGTLLTFIGRNFNTENMRLNKVIFTKKTTEEAFKNDTAANGKRRVFRARGAAEDGSVGDGEEEDNSNNNGGQFTASDEDDCPVVQVEPLIIVCNISFIDDDDDPFGFARGFAAMGLPLHSPPPIAPPLVKSHHHHQFGATEDENTTLPSSAVPVTTSTVAPSNKQKALGVIIVALSAPAAAVAVNDDDDGGVPASSFGDEFGDFPMALTDTKGVIVIGGDGAGWSREEAPTTTPDPSSSPTPKPTQGGDGGEDGGGADDKEKEGSGALGLSPTSIGLIAAAAIFALIIVIGTAIFAFIRRRSRSREAPRVRGESVFTGGEWWGSALYNQGGKGKSSKGRSSKAEDDTDALRDVSQQLKEIV